MIINQKSVKDIFSYRSGELVRKKTGRVAGCNGKRYSQVKVLGKQIYTHRIIFLMFHGYLPKMIDHIDGNKLNNDISNLRSCNSNENSYNSKINNRNKSGIKGVSWDSSAKKWFVSIQADKKRFFLGLYGTLDEALEIICKKRSELHKGFCNHG